MKSLASIPPLSRWQSQRHPLDEPIGPDEALCCNRSFRSAARLCARPDGGHEFRADHPPGRDQADRIAEAGDEIGSFAPDARPNIVTGPLDDEQVEFVVAAVRAAGLEPDPGPELRIPLGSAGEHARAVAAGETVMLLSTALARLPEDATCREAAVRYALEVTATVRLVRASVMPDGELVWQAALGPHRSHRFLEHALNALGAAHRVTRPELADLAAEPSLATAWLHCRASH